MDTCELLYTSARWNCTFDVFPSDRELEKLFETLFDQLEMTSSPGFPYVWNGMATNEAIRANPAFYEQVRYGFIQLMSKLRNGERLPKPTVRLFVKTEPHKIEKIRDGRFRLIWAMPIEYQLIHRLFFGPSLAAELAHYHEIPSKGGMSNVRGGFHRLYKDLYDGSDNFADIDKSGWDMHAAWWTILMERDVRWSLCLNPNPIFKHCFDACYESLLISNIIFSDGTLLEQVEPGIVRSGSMITLSGNSRMQVLLKILYLQEKHGGFVLGRDKIAAIGDDTLERMPKDFCGDFQKWLEQHGYKCKEIAHGPLAEREFCSHKFKFVRGAYVPIPTNWRKHAMSLCFKEKSKTEFFADQLFSLMLEYCFEDARFEQLRDAVVPLQPRYALSQRHFQDFVLGYESSSCAMIADTLAQVRKKLVGIEENPGPHLIVGVRADHEARVSVQIEFRDFGPHAQFVEYFEINETDILFHKDSGYSAPPKILEPFLRPLAKAFDSGSKVLGSIIPRDIGSIFVPSRFNESERAIPMSKQEKKTIRKILSKAGVRKMGKQKEKRVARVVAAAVAGAAPRAAKKKMRSGGTRLGFLQANKFNMDTARFGGRDLVGKIVLSGVGGAGVTSGKDVAGTVLFSTQIRPSVFIPNVRLGRLMSLFQKWRLMKARFTFKSSIPPGTNAGTMLFVHEPDANEIIPTQYAAPTAGTLSNYDSHSWKSLVPMAKPLQDFKGEHNDHLELACSKAIGPGGGWFVVDPENLATNLENSMGQFLILVQDAHNILGANAGLPQNQYEIGSLFFEYDIEVQTASDNSNLAGGYNFFQGVGPTGTAYMNSLRGTSTTFSPGAMLPLTAANFPGLILFPLMTGLQLSALWTGTSLILGFPESGVYLICYQVVIFTAADFGTTQSGPNAITHAAVVGSTGSVLHSHVTQSTALSAAGGSAGPVVLAVVDVEDPDLDFFQIGSWTVGTGGSLTVTGTSVTEDFRVVALPPEATNLMRKQKRKIEEEAKTVEDMKPKLEKMFEDWAAKVSASQLKPQRVETGTEALSLSSSVLLQTLEERLEAKKKATDLDVATTTATERWFVPRSSSKKG